MKGAMKGLCIATGIMFTALCVWAVSEIGWMPVLGGIGAVVAMAAFLTAGIWFGDKYLNPKETTDK